MRGKPSTHRNNDFSFSASTFDVGQSVRNVRKRICFVDGDLQFPLFDEFGKLRRQEGECARRLNRSREDQSEPDQQHVPVGRQGKPSNQESPPLRIRAGRRRCGGKYELIDVARTVLPAAARGATGEVGGGLWVELWRFAVERCRDCLSSS